MPTPNDTDKPLSPTAQACVIEAMLHNPHLAETIANMSNDELHALEADTIGGSAPEKPG